SLRFGTDHDLAGRQRDDDAGDRIGLCGSGIGRRAGKNGGKGPPAGNSPSRGSPLVVLRIAHLGFTRWKGVAGAKRPRRQLPHVDCMDRLRMAMCLRLQQMTRTPVIVLVSRMTSAVRLAIRR